MATIGSISLLGEGAVDITPAPEGTPLPNWAYVKPGVAPGSIAELTESATGGLEEAKRLSRTCGRGRAPSASCSPTMPSTAKSRALSAPPSGSRPPSPTARARWANWRKDPKLYDELERSIANLNTITLNLRNGEGTLGQLMNDPALANNLTTTTKNLESISDRLNKGEGTMGKLLNDDALYKRLDGLTTRLDTLVDRLSAGQGTAGQLLQDKQLYENMNQAASELRGLIGDIRKDPKKYLNVKVSLF